MLPETVSLDEELGGIRDRWLQVQRHEQDRIYAQEFGPRFAPVFAELPLHGAPEGFGRPKALISILGFSWQPVALMAAWAQPEQVLLIGTEESLALRVDGEPVLALIQRLSGVPIHVIEHRPVPEHAEVEIYRAVRDFLQRHKFEPYTVLIDPTGGKKSMSAAAALAGFLTGVRLGYVDYAEYDESRRIPVAGTEYPRLITNPLEILGDLELDRIREAFNAGNHTEARHLAEDLAKRLYEPRRAEAYALMARGYGAWEEFRFADALAPLRDFCDLVDRHAPHAGWAWAERIRPAVGRHVPLIETLSIVKDQPSDLEAGLPLVYNHLAAAKRALARGKISQTVMLLYATVERYVDLVLWTGFGLNDDEPDYASLSLDLGRYHDVGRVYHGKNYKEQELSGKLMYANGLQLLATMKAETLVECGPTDPSGLKALSAVFGPLRNLSDMRNKCEFEHGFVPRPPPRERVEPLVLKVESLLAVGLGGPQRLQEQLKEFAFPVL